jgi:opacity protein-like surface antigen
LTTFKTIVSACACATVLAGGATAAQAQDVTVGQTEALGFVGGVTEGGGAIIGGGIQYAFGPRLLFAGELGYLTGDDLGISNISSSGIAVNANVHYLFPSTNPKFTPYVLGGLGILRFSASASIGSFSSSASDTSAGLNIGGGARWKAGENWGVRPEIKIFIADGSNVQFTAGVYYKFGS